MLAAAGAESALICLYETMWNEPSASTANVKCVLCCAGVMSLDWHPQHTSLLAVGCYDGSVKVYDMRVRRAAPLYSSIPGHGQHRRAHPHLCIPRCRVLCAFFLAY